MRSFIPLPALALVSAPAAAAGGAVTIDISAIRGQVAELLRVDISQVPTTIKAPLGVAAKICGVSQRELAKTRTCTARSDSTAQVRDVVRSQ